MGGERARRGLCPPLWVRIRPGFPALGSAGSDVEVGAGKIVLLWVAAVVGVWLQGPAVCTGGASSTSGMARTLRAVGSSQDSAKIWFGGTTHGL